MDYQPPVFCDCKAKAARWISWSVDNPGRRYFKCRDARAGGSDFFFAWCDGPTSNFLRELLNDLRDTVMSLRTDKRHLQQEVEDCRARLEEERTRFEAARKEMVAVREIVQDNLAKLTALKARISKVRMRRQGQGQYGGGADINSMVAAQLHHYQTQQRVQQHPDNNYPGRDPGKAAEEQQYSAPKVRQSQWDRGGPNAPNQIPAYAYNEGQSAQGAQTFYDGQRSDLKVGLEKQPNKESRDRPRNDRFEARREDYNLPRTFEGLEQNFHEDIVILSKELHDAEDAENARHRERLNEINAQYQEKLLALRARQATYREEFLRKESQARQQQYQQASMSSYANNVRPGETHGYTPIAAKPPPPPPAAAATAGGTYGEAHRGYTSAQYDNFRERPDYPEFRGRGRGEGHVLEHRGQFPGGRAYNSGGRRF
ncbi:hypothetical protein OsI_10945 [Oryza sativa Indica Group]|nr:hypothetical protein OsI_10945 [Oryza sativa Indica Group]